MHINQRLLVNECSEVVGGTLTGLWGPTCEGGLKKGENCGNFSQLTGAEIILTMAE